MELCEVEVAAVTVDEEARFRALMQAHHYLGAAPKIGECVWYVAHRRGEWLALVVFSAAALKCRARDGTGHPALQLDESERRWKG